jgi:hypothetical protein
MVDFGAFFTRHPAERLHLRALTGRVTELIDSPFVNRIRELSMFNDSEDDSGLIELVCCPELKRLRALNLHGGAVELLLPYLAERPDAECLTDLFGVAGLESYLFLMAAASLRHVERIDVTLPNEDRDQGFDILVSQSDRWKGLDFNHMDTVWPLERLRQFPSLRDLGIPWCLPSGQLPELPRTLRRLSIHTISPIQLSDLARLDILEKLEHLSIDICGAQGVPFERGLLTPIGEITSRISGPILKLRFFYEFSRPIATLAGLPRAANIRELEFGGRGLTGDDFRSLAETLALPGLRRLKIDAAGYHSSWIESLATAPCLTGLRELDLSNNELSDQDVRTLLATPQLKRLRRLNLGLNSPGDNSLVALAEWQYLNRLRQLTVSSGQFKRQALDVLLNSPNLSPLCIVHLFECGVTDTDISGGTRERFGSRLIY